MENLGISNLQMPNNRTSKPNPSDKGFSVNQTIQDMFKLKTKRFLKIIKHYNSTAPLYPNLVIYDHRWKKLFFADLTAVFPKTVIFNFQNFGHASRVK